MVMLPHAEGDLNVFSKSIVELSVEHMGPKQSEPKISRAERLASYSPTDFTQRLNE